MADENPAGIADRLLGKPRNLPDLDLRKRAAREAVERAITYARDLVEPAGEASDLVLGTTETGATVTLPEALRNRHLYLIGKTRTGKTTLLTNIIKRDIREGRALCFIDPHGDAAQDLLSYIPPARQADTLYFDPSHQDAPAFNPLRLRYPPAKLTEDILSVFKMFYGDSWGPRMEHILRNAFLALLADPEPHCLADLKKLLTKEGYRKEVAARQSHPDLRDYWAGEFKKVPSNATQPIINKLSAFLAPMSDMERVFTERHNDLDFTEILDGKILIVNLSKGKIGEEPSRLLGGLITACIQQAALARANVAEANRTNFYFFVDEFQNYTVASFGDILSESAKYRVNLTLANQNLGQLPTDLRSQVWNAGCVIAFQVSAEDAPALVREMHRTRIRVRHRERHEWQPLHEFIEQWAYLADRYPEAQEALRPENTTEGWQRSHWTFVTKVFEAISLMPPSVIALKNAFAGKNDAYEFQEHQFPSAEDFSNLPKHHAFIKKDRADNVTYFRASPPDVMGKDERNRTALFAFFKQMAEERRRATELQQQFTGTEGGLKPVSTPAPTAGRVETRSKTVTRAVAATPPSTPAQILSPPPGTASPGSSKRPRRRVVTFDISREEPWKPPPGVDFSDYCDDPPVPGAPPPVVPEARPPIDVPEAIAEAASQPDEAVAEPTPPPKRERIPRKPRAPRTPAAPLALGKGGPKHKYLQDFVRRMAESKGFRAVIEEPVLGGDGSVDVVLYRDDRKIACEIGVSTTIEHEVGNVAKCRDAGFDEIILIAAEGRDAKKLDAALAGAAQVLRPEEFIEYLDQASPPEPKTRERTVKGYKVKTRFKPVESADAELRRKAVAQVLMQGLRRLKDS